MRIGILGGTFDPPHTAHLALAEAAADQLQLDEVIFMPAYKNPIKSVKQGTPAKHRLEMTKLLVAKAPRMAVSDLEITRGGPSYTVDTLTELTFAQPAEYWFILGADAVRRLGEWKQPTRLLKLCRLAVALRPPMTEVDLMARLTSDVKEQSDIITLPPMDISSSELRERFQKRQPVTPWVTPEVLNYIREHKLYQN